MSMIANSALVVLMLASLVSGKWTQQSYITYIRERSGQPNIVINNLTLLECTNNQSSSPPLPPLFHNHQQQPLFSLFRVAVLCVCILALMFERKRRIRKQQKLKRKKRNKKNNGKWKKKKE